MEAQVRRADPVVDPAAGAPGWWSPLERGVLELDALRVTRSLRKSLKRFEVRVDTALAEVVAGCADPRRPGGWIDDEVRAAYLRLGELGWVHSVEAWREGELVGGLYGVAIGGLFAGESMFHRERDASKAALVGLVELLRDEHAEVRVDTAFPQVIAACADPARPHGWIDRQIVDAYTRLHELGWAHSVEAWQDGELVGGLYGVAVGGLFAGESMFHRVTDASKVALVGLVGLLHDEHVDRRLLDVQWATEHLVSLGVVTVPRPTYLSMLRRAVDVPLPRPFR